MSTPSAKPQNIADRLTRLYAQTTPSTRRAGAAWYWRASDTIAAMASESGLPTDVVADVVAVLSPQCPWARNVAGARLALALHAAGADWTDAKAATVYGANVRKAWRILDGDRSALRGPKVEAFGANLRGDLSYVTVDVWATRAAIGRDLPGKDRAAIIAGYRIAARRAGVSPAEFQAIIWCHVRGSAI